MNFTEKFFAYLTRKTNIDGRITTALVDFLIKHSKEFDKASFILTNTHSVLTEYINQTEVDIAPQRYGITEETAARVDFAYPLKLNAVTFVTGKPKYKAQMFGIFQTLSLSVWITIFSILIALFLIYYITLRWKYSSDKILLNVFAILLRQSSMFKPTSALENLLVYSWVVGAMYFCLAYDSVFLSFLTFPSIIKIKDASQLASAVEKGEYNCITVTGTQVTIDLLKASQQKYWRILGRDLERNNLSHISVLEDFYFDKTERNLAFIGDAVSVELFGMGKKVVSEEPFLLSATAVVIRKNFCCKKLIETFVHRLMASGLYYKFLRDSAFFHSLPRAVKYVERDTERKLSLIDVAPAFIFLSAGYVISLLVFIGELHFSHWKKEIK